MTTITIKERHWNGAKRKNMCHCPAARAIRELVRPDVEVEVYGADVYFCGYGSPELVDSPQELHEFVKRWDDGEQGYELTFDLGIPERFLRATQ